MRTLTKELQNQITPAKAVELLQAGNARFVNNLKMNRNLLQQVNETSDGQHPFAVIVSCMDSRTTPELIFDQGLGDIFSIRVAGNVVNGEITGSAEYGCKVVGARAVVVLGHTGCGAVKGAIANVELGSLHFVTKKIQRSIPKTKPEGDICQLVTEKNVLQSIKDLRETSPILAEMEKAGEIVIVGGIYDIATGIVSFLETDRATEIDGAHRSMTQAPEAAGMTV